MLDLGVGQALEKEVRDVAVKAAQGVRGRPAPSSPKSTAC